MISFKFSEGSAHDFGSECTVYGRQIALVAVRICSMTFEWLRHTVARNSGVLPYQAMVRYAGRLYSQVGSWGVGDNGLLWDCQQDWIRETFHSYPLTILPFIHELIVNIRDICNLGPNIRTCLIDQLTQMSIQVYDARWWKI